MFDVLEFPAKAVVTVLFVFVLVVLPLLQCGCIGALCQHGRGCELYEAGEFPIDVETQFAVREPLCNAEKSACRIFSMHCTFWAYAWIIFFSIGKEIWRDDKALTVVGVIHLTICILFLWIETFRSLEYRYLKHKLDLKTCKAYIQDLIEQRPMLNLIVKADLSKRDNATAYYKKVKELPFSRWEDLSPSPDTLNLDADKVTRVKLLKLMIIGDNGTQSEYNCIQNKMLWLVRALYPRSKTFFSTSVVAEGHTWIGG